MKKFFTLVVFLGSLSAAFAQQGQDRNYRPRNDDNRNGGYESRNDNNNNNRRYDDAYKLSTKERDLLVMKISRDYNDKIESVRRRWFLNGNDKRRLITSLETEKSVKISSVYARFADSRNRYNDGYSYNNNNRRN